MKWNAQSVALAALRELGGKAYACDIAARTHHFDARKIARVLRSSGAARLNGRQINTYGIARRTDTATWELMVDVVLYCDA